MKPVKDRHLDAPGEANRDKHINFLAEENGDAYPADEQFDDTENIPNENSGNVDNGFFADDDISETNPKEHKHENSSEEIIPVVPDAFQAINNNTSTKSSKDKVSKTEDDEAH